MFGVLLIFVAVFGTSATAGVIFQDDTSVSKIQNENPDPAYPLKQKQNLAFGAYSIPTYPEYVPANSYSNLRNDEQSNSDIAPTRQAPLETWSSVIAKSLVPLSSFALYLGAKTIVYTLKFIATVLISIILTTSICTFTPLCHITFAGVGFNKTQIAEIAGPFMTTETLNKGTVMIGSAIDTFKEIQGDFDKNLGTEVTEKTEIDSVTTARNRRRRRYIQ